MYIFEEIEGGYEEGYKSRKNESERGEINRNRERERADGGREKQREQEMKEGGRGELNRDKQYRGNGGANWQISVAKVQPNETVANVMKIQTASDLYYISLLFI